uniref:Uncharacterized protein n=1 Tax=Tanacetum cinerariifolium TaxID=118510 RepID=A0A699Q592_TANCI|nr:hypothetical protein [Tanacetum cinerariifolium]
MTKFSNAPKRIEEDYLSIKDDVPLVSVYTTGNVLVRGMLEPGSHKENPKVVDDDDDDNKKEKVVEKKDNDIGSLETRTKEMQTTNPTLPSSPRKILSSDKEIDQELMDDVAIPTTTTSKHSQSKRQISNRYSHLSGALCRMCNRQGYMIQNIERMCVRIDKF